MLRTVRAEYFECAWRNNNLYSELSNILKILQRENIPVILLKGAHLARLVYSNIALRPMGDIDILVRKSDLLNAGRILQELGYSCCRDNEAEFVKNCQHLPPMLKQDAPPVELHWTLESPTTPFKIDVKGLWQRTRPASVAGVDTLTLSPEDLLLHLCLHTAVHHLYSNGLRALCDIRETVQHYRDELDWDTVQNHACEWGVCNAVYLTLYLAKSLLGADVPGELLNKLQPEQETRQSLAEAERLIFNGSDGLKITNPQARKLFASKSALKAAALFLQRIFLPRQTMAQLYDLPPDSPRILLYYPVRLKDLLARHNRTVWKIWRRDKATSQQFHLLDWLSR
jgi:hypothetical protein